MKILLQADSRAEAPPLEQLYIDRWYDKSTRNWVVTLKDRQGHQWGDTIVVFQRSEAMQIKKDHPSFNLPSGADDKYDLKLPPEFEKPCRALARKIQLSPERSFTVWDTKTRKRMFIVLEATSPTMLRTLTEEGKGVCGVLPLVRWMKAGLVRLARGQQEVTFRELLKG